MSREYLYKGNQNTGLFDQLISLKESNLELLNDISKSKPRIQNFVCVKDTGSKVPNIKIINCNTIAVNKENYEIDGVLSIKENSSTYEDFNYLIAPLLRGENVTFVSIGNTEQNGQFSYIGKPDCPGLLFHFLAKLFDTNINDITLKIRFICIVEGTTYDLLLGDVLKHPNQFSYYSLPSYEAMTENIDSAIKTENQYFRGIPHHSSLTLILERPLLERSLFEGKVQSYIDFVNIKPIRDIDAKELERFVSTIEGYNNLQLPTNLDKISQMLDLSFSLHSNIILVTKLVDNELCKENNKKLMTYNRRIFNKDNKIRNNEKVAKVLEMKQIIKESYKDLASFKLILDQSNASLRMIERLFTNDVTLSIPYEESKGSTPKQLFSSSKRYSYSAKKENISDSNEKRIIDLII